MSCEHSEREPQLPTTSTATQANVDIFGESIKMSSFIRFAPTVICLEDLQIKEPMVLTRTFGKITAGSKTEFPLSKSKASPACC